MIQGSPYQRLVAVNGKPVAASVRQSEQQKLEQNGQTWLDEPHPSESGALRNTKKSGREIIFSSGY